MNEMVVGLLLVGLVATGAAVAEKRDAHVVDKFQQLGTVLRDPNVYRTAGGEQDQVNEVNFRVGDEVPSLRLSRERYEGQIF